MKKIISALIITSILVSSLTFTGCKPKYEGLDTNVTGEISIMLWSGDGTYMEDLGHQDLTADDLLSQNMAAAYATAKAFNAKYPNVKINAYAKAGGPNDNGVTWAQELENFKAEHGTYPSLYASTDLVGDISKGLIADLSVFKDDPVYKSFNKSVMAMMNYSGFQGGLPQYLIPWGVFVNKSLAEDNNIDVPEPNWTIDEYTDFVSQANMTSFYGSMDVPMSFIGTGTTSIRYSLLNYKGDGKFVQLDSDEVKDLISYIPTWSKYAVYPQNDLGNIPAEVMSEMGSWSYNFLINNKILVDDGDPWMMGDAAHPDETHWGRMKAADWDIYPRPSTAYQKNTVGVVLDPLAVYNYAMDDGDPAMSDEEMARLKIAYTFAAFWVGSSEAIQARADQQFNDKGTLKTCLNDSLPLVTGDEFTKQMDIWYQVPTHQRFKDTAKMPGWAEVLKIWEAGQFWDISDKAYPYYHNFEGAQRVNLYEWDNYWNKDITGAMRTDANFVDVLKSKLTDWNVESNKRFQESIDVLHQAMIQYYGYKESDFAAKK